VVTGGDVDAGTLVSEEYLMTLERRRSARCWSTPRRRSASWACCPPASRFATDPVMDAQPNRMQRQLERLSEVPGFLRPWVRNLVLRRAVPFTGTAGLDFVEMSPQRVEVAIANERPVQNHLQGVHASAMNLLAETATGMVVGMNVRDDCVPLAKELKMAFRKRATGALRAVAVLTPEQRATLQASDKGELNVSVVVTDEAGVNPVECEFIWAWIPSGPRTR
jgi:acyl-coenzyme A thioesterase PaaI-like protein